MTLHEVVHLRIMMVKPDGIQTGDIIDLSDEPRRGRRLEEVDVRVITDEHVHVFFKGWGYPVAISRDTELIQVIRDVE